MTASIRGGIFTMAMLLKGAEVAKALTEELHAKTEELKKNGVEPCLAILRVGAREDDLAYERGALKRCEKVGVAVRQVVLPEDVTQEVLMENIHALNADEKVHGVLMFRPLPKHLDDEAARAALDPKKDMDGITDGSMTAVYAGTKGGYPPCTAAACVALLKHYNIPIKGKRVVVIGRSLVIGKPVSLLLLAEHATVTICHSRSENLPDICREADILVVAAGKAGMVGAESVRAGQVVLDVGIHVGADGNLCGDTRFAEVEPVVEAITAALNGDFAWLGAGLTVAGGALPAVGFAILLRYLPVKKHIAYLILGFVIAALLGTLFTNVAGVAGDVATAAAATETAINGGDYNSLSMLTIALIGFALAYIYYVQNKAQAAAPAAAAAVEGDDDDEL